MSAHSRKKDVIGIIACLIFTLLSLGFGVYMSLQVQRMESVGIHADAVITRIEKGAKNSKFPVVAFRTLEDRDVEAKCLFQLFVIRHETGDKVTVLYDPSAPQTVMIDNGLWNWDQPIFAILGGFMMLGLAVLIMRSLAKQKGGG